MQSKPLEPNIEVSASSLNAILDGFGAFRSVAAKYLVQHGLSVTGTEVDADAWIRLEAWLAAFGAIGREVGAAMMFNIGRNVPARAHFPAHVVDIETGLWSIDVAYHMNHRKLGKVMFDGATGAMTEGIGHYGYARAPDDKRVISVCDNPYPCDFDRGIISSVASRFQRGAAVTHQPGACRTSGADRCTYVITW